MAKTETQEARQVLLSDIPESGLYPPPTQSGSDAQNLGRNGSKAVVTMEVKETVTHINSPSLETFQSATLNINSPASPSATWSFELQLNEIDAALQVIDPLKFPIQKRNPPTPLILDLSPFIAISIANH